MNPINNFWTQFYASLTVDKLLCAAIALLALLIIAIIAAVKRGREIESLRQQLASLPETKPVTPVPEPPQPQHSAPVPVQFVEVPSDRVLDMARELCDNADTAYEAACREMDEQVQRARAFYRLQQDKAYAVLKELRDSERALRPSVQPQVIDVQPEPEPEPAVVEPEAPKKPQPHPAKDDPYNLGSLDDLDEE